MQEAETLDRHADRRRYFRKPVHKNAELTLRTGEDVFDCTVIDESYGGVQVDFGEVLDLPDEVVIRFSNEASQLVRRCWSLGTRVGYQFIDPVPAVRREVRDVTPPAREAEPAAMGDYACMTPVALGMHQSEMNFVYPAERIHALLMDEAETRRMFGSEDALNFFGPRSQ